MRANDSFIVFSKKKKINWACISDLPCACHYVIIFKNVFFNQNKGNQSIGPLGSHPQYLYYKSQVKNNKHDLEGKRKMAQCGHVFNSSEPHKTGEEGFF